MKMAKNLFLLDTQIWIDHYLERGPSGIYGKQALKLILKIIEDDLKVVFSNFNEKEMKDIGLSQTEINALLSMIKPDHIKRVSVTKVQFEEAYRVAKQRNIPFGDAVHAILARDHDAQMVSRDEKDFRKIKEITEFKEPTDLI